MLKKWLKQPLSWVLIIQISLLIQVFSRMRTNSFVWWLAVIFGFISVLILFSMISKRIKYTEKKRRNKWNDQ